MSVNRYSLKRIKNAIATLIHKGQPTPEPLRHLNQSFNHIESEDVRLPAIKGSHITIMKGSYVCENSEIDSYTYVGFNTFISKTVIGKYNSIANNVNIGHGEHPLHFVSTSSFINETPYEELTKSACIISHDVWIGSGATIRRGVTLGIGCIVGANTFVNKDVPPFAVVGGVPSKILKFRFPQDKIDVILASKWWENEPEIAKKIIKDLEASHYEIIPNGIRKNS